jgi:hypothetical protein
VEGILCKSMFMIRAYSNFNMAFARLSFRGGVVTAVTAPSGDFLLGVSTAFSVGSSNALEKYAILQDEAALHVALSRRSTTSVSTQIAALRRILFDAHFFATSTNYSQDALCRVRKVTESVDKSKWCATYSYSHRAISHSSCTLIVLILWPHFSN